MPALAQGTVFFSSSSLNNPSYQLSGSGSNGWSPSGSCIDQYLGVQTSLQTFYAIDIKQLSGSALSSFSIEYSMDGKRFIAVQDFTFDSIVIGSVTTFYFKAVEAKYIRLVVREGTPNIRVEFYYSKAATMGQVVKPDTFIGKTVAASVNGIENGGVSNCSSSNGLCWAGVESCQPKEMKGFSLIYQSQSTGSVSEITIEYSTDGVNFVCYQDCKPIALTGDGLVFPSPLLSEKVHVHFVTYTGHPSFGVKFDFL